MGRRGFNGLALGGSKNQYASKSAIAIRCPCGCPARKPTLLPFPGGTTDVHERGGFAAIGEKIATRRLRP